MLRLARLVCLIALVVGAKPSIADAEWLLTPYFGGLWLDIADAGTRPVVGGSFVWIRSVAGFELDVADGPSFLESRPGQVIDQSNLFTLMTNGVVQFPTTSRRIRPYAVGGIGMIATNVTIPDDAFEISEQSFGFNVGGGLVAFLNDRVGIRGDLRYFQASRNDDAPAEADALEISELKFLRFTVGVTFEF